MTAETPGKTIYFDTNVISYVDSGRAPDFLAKIIEKGHKLIVSDTVLEELPNGRNTRILSAHNFLYVFSHEAAFLGGLVNFYRSVEPSDRSSNVDGLELFLRSLLRSAAGSLTAEDLNALFHDATDDLWAEIARDLPEGTDTRIVAQLEAARKRFKEGLELLPPMPSPVVTKEEIAAHQMAPKQLNNVKPPSVVGKIIGLYPDATEWLERLIAPFGEEEDVKSRIQELCFALILLGFARDRGIGKSDPRKSDDGARAQFQDISHICSAAVCDLFITADKRCAKLAFAVFEALSLKTAVLHLLASDAHELRFGLLGSDYWP